MQHIICSVWLVGHRRSVTDRGSRTGDDTEFVIPLGNLRSHKGGKCSKELVDPFIPE